MSARKPHQDFAGYRAELRNPFSGGHTIISDCKLAEQQGEPIVEDYAEEGGRYQVLCNEHGHLVYCSNMPVARECMKDPTSFCIPCRVISGNGPADWERELSPDDVAAIHARLRVVAACSPAWLSPAALEKIKKYFRFPY